MSCTPALRFLRQCTASLTPWTAGRHSVHVFHSSSARMRTRHYSGDKADVEDKEHEQKNAPENASEADDNPGEGSMTTEKSTSGLDPQSQLSSKLQAKEQEVIDLTGRLRYLQADYLNLQRNAAREKEQTRDFAITRFAGDLLETADVLSLALKSVPEAALNTPTPSSLPSSALSANASLPESTLSQSFDTMTSFPPDKSPQAYLNELHRGVEMTHRLLLQTLFKYGVKPFDPTGDKFDPNRHEALYQAPVPGKEPGTVIDCQKIGYSIKDRTLRAAQVGVVAEAL